MDDNTMFLRSILRQDWEAYDRFVVDFTRQGKGTPVAIIGCAFHIAVRRHFGVRRDMPEIIQFVAGARAFLAEGRDLPPREAEGLVCATLDMDEPWVEEIVDRLDVGAIAVIEGELLFKLIHDENLSVEQLDAFLAEAEELARQWQAPA